MEVSSLRGNPPYSCRILLNRQLGVSRMSESISARKKSVRQFYNTAVTEHLRERGDFRKFMPECWIGYVFLYWDGYELLPPEIKRPTQEVPKTVLDTFERHLWYSRHNLSDIYLLRIPVEGPDTYIFLIQGHCHDAWDNGCQLVETFDQRGEPLGAGSIRHAGWEGDTPVQYIDWMDRQLDSRDYYKPAPPWDGDPLPEDFSYHHLSLPILWSEEPE